MRSPHHSPALALLFRAVVFLVVLAVAFVSTVYVTGLHLHVLPDGRAVVHSHPVDKDKEDNSPHQHTTNEYAILSAQGRLGYVDSPLIVWSPVFVQPVTSWIELLDDNATSYSVARAINERGPPKITSA